MWLESVIKDLRFAAQMLYKRPRFTLPAVLSLALALGATTAIYSLVNAVFLQPIPVEAPERLIALHSSAANPSLTVRHLPISYPNFLDLREQSETVSDMTALARTQLSLSGSGEPTRVYTQLVTANYFDVLGVTPIRGRDFSEDKEGSFVVVLSHTLWEEQFGGDPDITRQTVRLNGFPFSVVGVAPKGFRGPTTMGSPEIWIPFWTHPQLYPYTQYVDNRRAQILDIFGRLTPDAGFEEAEAELATIGQRLREEYPEENEDQAILVRSIADSPFNPNMRDRFVAAGAVLLGASALVLFIACFNVANLLLAQAAARKKEIALRLSLGVSRGALVRQLMIESVLVALLGAVAGIFLAIWGKDVLWSLRPAFLSAHSIGIELNWQVLGFAVLVALVAGLAFGLVPALQGSRPHLVTALKEGDDSADGRHRLLGRKALLVAQVALSLVSLVAAGLYLKSLQNAQRIETGYNVENLLTLNIHLGSEAYDETRGRQFYDRLLEEVRGLPDVVDAALIENPPFDPGAGLMRRVTAEGQDLAEGERPPLVRTSSVSRGYFETLGLPLLQGRDFTTGDHAEAPQVAIVNETMAKSLWPGQEAIGQGLRLTANGPRVEVIAVAQDSKYISMTEEPTPYIYLYMGQNFNYQMTLELRSRGATSAVVGPIRQLLRDLDPTVPISEVQTVEERIATSLWMPRMAAGLLSIFGFLALALAIVGVYGVLSHSVHQRRREIGIRMSIGAERSTILGLILKQSSIIIGLGLAFGIVLAFAAHRLVQGMLFGVERLDLATLAGVTLLLLTIALAAAVVPAVRATRIDPVTVLRAE